MRLRRVWLRAEHPLLRARLLGSYSLTRIAKSKKNLVVHHASAVCHVGDDKELVVVNFSGLLQVEKKKLVMEDLK